MQSPTPHGTPGAIPESLSREVADHVLARAIELQHEWGDIIPTDTLRATAAEVGIDPRFVEMALGEIGTGQPAAKPAAQRAGCGTFFLLALLFGIGIAMGNAMARVGGQEPAAPAPVATAPAPPAPEAPRPVTPAPAARPAVPANAEALFKAHCEREWKTDFHMRAYCEDQQRTAVKELARLDAEQAGMPPDAYAAARTRCADEWENDFHMTVYCMEQQIKGYEEISG